MARADRGATERSGGSSASPVTLSARRPIIASRKNQTLAVARDATRRLKSAIDRKEGRVSTALAISSRFDLIDGIVAAVPATLYAGRLSSIPGENFVRRVASTWR